MSVRSDYLDKIEQLKKFAEHYYHKNESLVTDQVYDMIVEEVEKAGLDNDWTEHKEITEKVAGGTSDNESDIEHKTRMLSLKKVNDENELISFIKKVETTGTDENTDYFVIEPKLDGLALRVIYKNGKREIVSTRGDSRFGKNVTKRANEIVIEGLPQKINDTRDFEVRGELFITNENYEKIQNIRLAKVEQYEKEKELAKKENRRATLTSPPKPFTLQRSSVSGTINAKQGTESFGIILNFAAYDVIFVNEKDQPHTYTEALAQAEENGFITATSILPKLTSKNIIEKIKEFGELRDSLPYPTDGAVVKVNSQKQRNTLGAAERHPNWAVAYKYEEEVKTAQIAEIVRSVGKSGAISYVGVFKEPILLSGSQVGRATLNNAEMIRTLDIRINDTVMVRKANGIIPEILAVRIADRENNNVSENPYEAPTTCPQCKEQLDTESSIIWRCHNPQCSKLESIIYAISKKNFDVQGLGKSTIEILVEKEIINDVTDLFKLSEKEWENLVIRTTETGNPVYYGKPKTKTTLESLNKSLNVPLEKIISSLNLRFVGETFGRRFAHHYKTFENFINTTEDELMTIEGVKDKARIIIEEIQKNSTLIEKYKKVGFTNLNQYENKNDDKIVDQKLANENIVITGAVPGYTRDEVKELIFNLGGKPGSSVSSKTTLVVAPADERETSKAKKAQQLGITIITPEEFLQRIQ